MHLIWLRIRAPFAAFRYFQAGVYRAVSPTIPYSAAWGLVLNLAGIEVRKNQDNPITEIDPSSPPLLIAIGNVDFGERNALYQQLHSYPVGTSGKELAPKTKGAKYWIAPVKREILAGFDAVVGIQTKDGNLANRIKLGLSGKLTDSRYGLPFAGDNNLLFDQIQILDEAEPAYWYLPVSVDEGAKPQKGSCRLSVKIDRVDASKSISRLFAPQAKKNTAPPNEAWIWTPREP